MNKLLKEAFAQKEQHRKDLAKLPFEQKINILGALQRTYFETRRKVDSKAVQSALTKRKLSS